MKSAIGKDWERLDRLNRLMGRSEPMEPVQQRVSGLFSPLKAYRFRRPLPPKRVRDADEKEEEEKTDEGQKKRTSTGRAGGVRQEVPDHPLSDDQQSAVAAALNKNTSLFFLTGPAGSGKTFVLRHIINRLLDEGKDVAVTAATGIAATNFAGATTLHRFAGLGGGRGGRTSYQKKEAEQNWRNVDVVVVDEISMIDDKTLDLMDREARSSRNEPDKPFGGVWIIVSGDFAQLPPVAKESAPAYESKVWKEHAIEYTLDRIHRQKDGDFMRALGMIGRGLKTNEEKEEVDRIFAPCFTRPISDDAVHLYALREPASRQNQDNLKKLPGQVHVFRATDTGSRWADETIAPSTVELKVGARVMLTTNLDVQRGLVNGALGYVAEFVGERGPPVVKFDCGIKTPIDKFKWTIKKGGGLRPHSTREQIPLTLAWAITIHKSQGRTLNCNVVAHIGDCFAPGQVYVVATRCTDLDKLAICVPGDTFGNAKIIPGLRPATK